MTNLTLAEKENIINEVVDNLAANAQQAFKFKEGFTQSLLASAIVGLDGSWIEVNQSLCDLIGYTSEELKQKTWQEITVAEYLTKDLRLVMECIAGKRQGYSLHKKYYHKTGSIVEIMLYVSIINASGEKFFLSQIVSLDEMRERCKTGNH